MANNVTAQQWIACMQAKGHVPKLDEFGDLDFSVRNEDIHNGPGCVVCEQNWCWHCSDPQTITKCTGR